MPAGSAFGGAAAALCLAFFLAIGEEPNPNSMCGGFNAMGAIGADAERLQQQRRHLVRATADAFTR